MPSAKFPELSQYLLRLPDGMASYPECETKASLIRSSLEGHAYHPDWDLLPDELREVLREPPLPVDWASAVMAKAVFSVVVDTYYPNAELVRGWSYDRAIRLSKSTMYRIFTRVTGVRNLLRATARVNGMFQRGSDLSAELHSRGAILLLTHPRHLHSPMSHIANEAGLRAVLEAAGARDLHFELTESRPDGARYDASFSG